MKLLWGICGSFCNHEAVFSVMEKMAEHHEITPVLSKAVCELDTRFTSADQRRKILDEITGKVSLTTLQQAEWVGPCRQYDAMILAPLTATSCNRLVHGLYDDPVTLAAKAMIRNHCPLIIGIASNDFLGISGLSLMKLKQKRDVYFVPFRQDDPLNKPDSLISEWSLIEATLNQAMDHEQIQPLLLGTER